jgi:amidase
LATEPSRPAAFTLEEATIADINAALDAGLLTCPQLTALYLSRIDAYDSDGPRLNSIITVNPRALDAERRLRGPCSLLHCVPVLLKDNIDTADLPTSNGSVIMKDSVPKDDSYHHETAARSSARPRWANSPPPATTRSPGRSSIPTTSSGIPADRTRGRAPRSRQTWRWSPLGPTPACRFAPRPPSTASGLRPPTGLISRAGIVPKNLLSDPAGPMARSVTDMAILLSGIAGPDSHDPLGFNARVYENHPMYKGYGPSIAFAKVDEAPGVIDYTKFLKRASLKGARLGVVRDYWGGAPEIVALGAVCAPLSGKTPDGMMCGTNGRTASKLSRL